MIHQALLPSESWIESGAKDAIDSNCAQAACDDAGPGCFAGSIGVRRQNPLAARGLSEALMAKSKALADMDSGLSERYSDGANMSGDVGLQAGKSGAGGGPVVRGAEMGELLKEHVYSIAERALEKPALVTHERVASRPSRQDHVHRARRLCEQQWAAWKLDGRRRRIAGLAGGGMTSRLLSPEAAIATISLIFSEFRRRAGRFPFFKANIDFVFEGWPCGGEEAIFRLTRVRLPFSSL